MNKTTAIYALFLIQLPITLILSTGQLHTADEPAPIVAAAAVRAPTHLNMEQAAAIAWTQSRRVLIAHSQYAARQAQSSIDTSFLKPQFSIGADYTQQDDVVNSFGFQSSSDVYSYNAQTDLFLYGFGKRGAAKDAALYSELAAQSHLQSARNEAALLSRTTVLEIMLSYALITINQSRVSQRSDETQDAQALESAGTVSKLDVRQSQINLARTDNELIEVQTQSQLKILQLIEILSPQLNNQKIIIEGSLPDLPDIAQLLNKATTLIHTSSDLSELQAQQDSTRASSILNRSDRLPQFAAHAGYAGSGEDIDDTIDQWSVGVGLQWKIYDGGARGATDTYFQATLRGLSEQTMILHDSRQRFLQSARIQNSQLQKTIIKQTTIVALAKQNYEDTRIMYQTGTTTITRLGESSLALDESRYTLARYQYLLHKLGIQLLHFIEREPTGLELKATP